MTGFVVMARNAIDHPLLQDGERFRAWFWLVARACWKPTKFDLFGKVITLERGQLCTSRNQLADAWGWSPSAVERFLTRLETEQMIGRATGQGRTVITILNYSKYQEVGERTGQQSGQASGQPADSQRTAKEPLNQITLPNGNGAEAPNLTEKLWSDGLAVVTASDVPDAKARALLGKWRKVAVDRLGKDEGEARVLAMLAQAQRDHVLSLVPWMEAAIRGLAGPPRHESREDREKRERAEYIERNYGPDSPRARMRLAAGGDVG